jgi:hypothetical protein
VIVPGVESRYFSSFDRRGGNADGFRGRYSALYRLESGEHVIFDALGPGVLRTLWFTGPEEGGEGLDLGAIRFYLDDEARPRIETDVERLFAGKQAPFSAPLVANNRVSTGGFVSWVPIPYRKRLIITTQRRAGFYIAQYDTLPAGSAVASWRPGQDHGPLKRAFEAAARGLTAQAGLVRVPLSYRHRGAGTVELLRFEPADAAQAARLGQARITIAWDGSTRPAVDAPLDAFFGSGLGPTRVRAVAFAMSKRGYENRLPMPFWRGFALRVMGIEGTLRLRIGPPRFARGQAGHLHATFRDERLAAGSGDFLWGVRRGAGKLVGTVLTIRPPTPETKRWWEGDLRSYADGRRTPGLHGTGHEDDHLGGWSNTFFSRAFTLPMHGEPRVELIETEGVQHNARISLYRLWPGIHFMDRLSHGVEHGSGNRVPARYAGLALYYALPGPGRLETTDTLTLGDPASRARHGYRLEGEQASKALRSAFEGRAFRETVEGLVHYHRGPARFHLKARPDNRGCFLRRTYDQRQGRQRAAVRVDGARVADWYTAEGNPHLRWAERDLFLPAAVTGGKRRLAVEILPGPAGPEWSAAAYALLCVAGPTS